MWAGPWWRPGSCSFHSPLPMLSMARAHSRASTISLGSQDPCILHSSGSRAHRNWSITTLSTTLLAVFWLGWSEHQAIHNRLKPKACFLASMTSCNTLPPHAWVIGHSGSEFLLSVSSSWQLGQVGGRSRHAGPPLTGMGQGCLPSALLSSARAGWPARKSGGRP